MRLELMGQAVVVTLSRRNLLTLLAKLEIPGSRRTILLESEAGTLAVRAEADDVHYADRLPPGEMEPVTEARAAELSGRRFAGPDGAPTAPGDACVPGLEQVRDAVEASRRERATEIIDRLGGRAELTEEEAERLADEAKHAARRRRKPGRGPEKGGAGDG